jgi:hypothetical protein
MKSPLLPPRSQTHMLSLLIPRPLAPNKEMNLATATERKYQMQSRATLEAVIGRSLVVRPEAKSQQSLQRRHKAVLHYKKTARANEGHYSHLFAAENEALLRRRDTFLLLNTLFYP